MKGIVMDVALPTYDCQILAGTKLIWNGTLRENAWRRRLVLPKNTQSVTIKVRKYSNHEKVGILASFSNGNVTDGSWRCVNSTTCNWESNSCSSVMWESASVVPNNGVSTPARYPEIASNAKWIWISYHSPANVWCKKTFGKFQYCIKCLVNYHSHYTSVCIGKNRLRYHDFIMIIVVYAVLIILI